ncbi:hypothetical protein [Mucilaginibacter sp.]
MKAIEKLRESEDVGRKMAINNDFNKFAPSHKATGIAYKAFT